MRLPLQEASLPRAVMLRLPPGTKSYTLGECRVILSRDDLQDGRDVGLILPGRWHLSISHPDRYPTWDEIVEARDRLLPQDLHFCMVLPPREFWMSIHRNCFHLYELRDVNLIQQCEAEGLAVRGTSFGGHQPSGP